MAQLLSSSMPSDESLQEMLQRWRSGDQAAATNIYRRYEQRLLRLAERKIGPRLRSRVEPDDIMLSVLDTVLKRIAKGQYSVDPSGSVWSLLRTITDNKIRKHAEYHGAGKRDIGAEVDVQPDELLSEAVSREPTPDEAALLADELEKIHASLKPSDFQVFELDFQGYSASEIAAKVDCSRWTVRRTLDRIGHRLRRQAGGESDR